jgi:hypothetical protein
MAPDFIDGIYRTWKEEDLALEYNRRLATANRSALLGVSEHRCGKRTAAVRHYPLLSTIQAGTKLSYPVHQSKLSPDSESRN